MDEATLQDIQAYYEAQLPGSPFIGQLRVNELIAEVRRLRDQNKAREPDDLLNSLNRACHGALE